MIKRLSVIIALGIALSLSACGNTAKVNEPIEAEKVTEAIESTPEVTEEPETATEEAEELSVIYADDEEINLYLNRYNEANVGQEITADQFEPYKHHGSVHKNQIKFKRIIYIKIRLYRYKTTYKVLSINIQKRIFLAYFE